MKSHKTRLESNRVALAHCTHPHYRVCQDAEDNSKFDQITNIMKMVAVGFYCFWILEEKCAEHLGNMSITSELKINQVVAMLVMKIEPTQKHDNGKTWFLQF